MSYIDQSAGGAEFVQFAKHLALGRGRISDAIASAEGSPRCPMRVVNVLRAATAPGVLSDPTWAGNLADLRTISTGFLESLRHLGGFDRILQDNAFRRIPLRTRIVSVTLGASGALPAENVPKPVSRMTLAGATLEPRKATSIVVVSSELLKSLESGADAFLASEMRAAVATASDAAFFAGISLGASTVASSGSTAAAVAADIRALLELVDVGARSRLYLLMSGQTAKELSTLTTTDGATAHPDMSATGGSMFGLPAVVTDAIVPDTSGASIVLLDASSIAANSDVVVVDYAEHASLQLDDAPTNPANATTVFQSLWQRDLVALRSERWFAFEVTGERSVAVLTGADYGS